MLNILKSLSITVIISLVVGTLFWTLGYDPIKASVFTLIGQLAFFYVFNTIIESKAIFKNKELENERIKEFSKQGTIVPCAYCSVDNFIPIRFDSDNKFPCTACTKQNSVYINITTAQVTSPLEANPLMVQSYIAEKEQAIAKLQESFADKQSESEDE
jgi:hypothetical protein